MESKAKFKLDGNLRLMDQVGQAPRYHHYAYRTEQTYCDWIVRYIKFHGAKRHPQEMGKTEIYTHVMQKDRNAVVSPLDHLMNRRSSESLEARD